MLLTLREAILLSGHIGMTFPRQREFNQLSVCTVCHTSYAKGDEKV